MPHPDAYRDTRTPVVIVVRDPDASNDIISFGGPVRTHDIDAGYMDLGDPEEYKEWHDGHYDIAEQLEADGYADAASFIRNTVDAYDPD